MTTYDFAYFLNVKSEKGDELHAHCPFHDDHTPSFSANIRKGLWKCHAGCGGGTFQTFLARLRGEEVAPSLPPRRWAGLPTVTTGRTSTSATHSASRAEDDWKGFHKVAEYLYLDWQGRELVRLVRWEDGRGQKRFVYKDIRKNLDKGRNTKALACPYRYEAWRNVGLDEVIFVVEGEKCVNFLFGLGLTATTFLGGSMGWNKGLKCYFRDRRVVILPDNNLPGGAFGKAVLAGVTAVAADVRLVELPGLSDSEDVVDWFAKGGTVADLKRLTSQ